MLFFCDNSRESLNLIKTNIEKCGAQDQAVVLAGDYTKALSKTQGTGRCHFPRSAISGGLL